MGFSIQKGRRLWIECRTAGTNKNARSTNLEPLCKIYIDITNLVFLNNKVYGPAVMLRAMPTRSSETDDEANKTKYKRMFCKLKNN